MTQYEYDVIVVGAGTAGLPAAICAAERGLKVALVEAADDIGGTLHMSSGSMGAAGTSIQTNQGLEDSPARHYADCLKLNHGTGDLPLLKLWTEEAPGMIEWLLSIGWTCDPPEAMLAYEHDLYDVARTYRSTGQGLGILSVFRPIVERHQASGAITLSLNTRFDGFLTEDGKVVGISARRAERRVEISGRAVILTTGGYSASERHWRELHGLVPLRYYRDASMGDALDPVNDLGGYTRYANYALATFGATRDIGSPASAWIHTVIHPHFRPPWEIYVDAAGRRFMPEDERSIDRRERYVSSQPGWFFWCVYDHGIRMQSPRLFRWDDDKLEALFAEGEDYLMADTLEALEHKCGLPPNSLVSTVEDYNRGQAVGSDALFRRHLPAPINSGPFYAVKHYGISIVSAAGVAVNRDLAVVREDGAPIEGLFAAGESTGYGVLGHGLLSGSIVSMAITFGRLLGQQVLAKAAAAPALSQAS